MRFRCGFRVAALAASLVLPAACLTGCGGRSGEDGMCITFGSGASPAPSTAVTRQGSTSNCDVVKVEVVLDGVSDVAAVAFEVTFDPALVAYDGCSLNGSHLNSDGAQVEILQRQETGRVSLGLTRLSPAAGIDFADPGVVVRLRFRKAAGSGSGSAPLAFTTHQVFGSEEPPQAKTGIDWFGGTLRVE